MKMIMRTRLWGLGAALALVSLAIPAAQAQTICQASSPSPVTASSTGTAELVGDYLLQCTGGSGTVSANLVVFFNTSVSQSSIPKLSVDDGVSGPFSATFTSSTSITFLIAFAAPGSGMRVLRINSVRVNAAQLSGLSANVTEAATVSGSGLGITNSQQIVASVGVVNPLSCSASSNATTVSSTGTAEVAGDYLLTCSGGTGQVNTTLTVNLNTGVANTTTPTLNIASGGTLTGTVVNSSTIVFPAFTFTAPGIGVQTLTVTNVRVNAAQLGTTSGTITESGTFGNTAVSLVNSNQVVANIGGGTPALSSISPTSAPAGGPAFVLTLSGTNFNTSSQVQWNGLTLQILSLSTTQLTVNVPASLITNAGTAIVAVVNAGNVSSIALPFAIGSGSGLPTVQSLVPAATSGTNQTLAVVYSNGSGYSGLGVVNVLINTALDGRHACYVAYSVATNTIFLVDDAGDAGGPYASLVLPSSGNASNSQCTINGAGSSAVGNGTLLTLTMNITFNASFAGNKVVYAAAGDKASNNSGWQTMGVYGVPPLPSSYPSPVGLFPASGSTSPTTITLVYQDATSASNLQTAWALVNTSLDGRSACYVAYYRPANVLYLVPDSGDGTQAVGMTLNGGAGTLSNSQCSINIAGSQVIQSGIQLNVSLNITFQHVFTGPKAIWMAVSTLANQVSPWQSLGAWRVP